MSLLITIEGELKTSTTYDRAMRINKTLTICSISKGKSFERTRKRLKIDVTDKTIKLRENTKIIIVVNESKLIILALNFHSPINIKFNIPNVNTKAIPAVSILLLDLQKFSIRANCLLNIQVSSLNKPLHF